MRHPRTIVCALLASIFMLMLLPHAALAQWVTDGAAVCTELLDQYQPCIVADGSGGGITAWVDRRGGTYHIYAQRIDSDGYVQWTSGGVLVCASTGTISDPLAISDGAGGAYIVWIDQRNGNADIYAQRIGSGGTPLWTANGVAVCTDAASQSAHSISSDNMGGVSIAWMDYRNANYDIYMQRLDPTGVKYWAANGVVVCNTTGSQQYPEITGSAVGGSIVVWDDDRGSDQDIYAQYISSIGTRQWGVDGIAISTAADDEWGVKIAPDGSNGAFMVWINGQLGVYTSYAIFAQRVSFSGTVLWTTNGVLVCDDPGRMRNPQIMPDGEGGTIICWDSPGRLPEPWAWQWGVFASKLDGNGVPQWGPDGIPVYQHGANGGAFYYNNSQLVSDGFGGAIITWDSGNIQAQRVDADGALMWGPDGQYACQAVNDTQSGPQLIPDGYRGAIIAWQDARTTANGLDIYAQRVMTHECAVSTDSLDFGAVPVGQKKTMGFTITNLGGVTLTGSISIPCPQFSLAYTVPPDDPFVLEGGEHLWVYVNFDPTVSGTDYCTVETGESACIDVECVGSGSDCPSGTIYVDWAATGSGDGTSWTDALTDLQEALALVEFCGTIDTIWVAAGTYTPTSGTDRTVSFALPDNVAIYGGFDGTEALLEERDVEANPTILSGDLGTVNSYHVVTSDASVNMLTVLDGFIITGGVADGVAEEDQRGGGMYNLGAPTVRYCTFMDNTAAFGGGMCCENSTNALRLDYVSFIGNVATSGGGGMYCVDRNQVMNNIVFRGNSAPGGSGMYNQSTGTTSGYIRNVVFEENDGSAMSNNGSSPQVVNGVFYGNTAAIGAGMRNMNGSSPALINVSFGNNIATSSAGGMSNGKGSSPAITNAVFWGNEAPDAPQIGNVLVSTPVISYSIIEGCGGSGAGWDAALGTDAGNNLDFDPRWKTEYTSDPLLMLWSSSPAINTGSNAAVPGGVTTDPAGNPRFYDVTVDRGAYEYQGGITDAGEDVPPVPETFALHQNVPNPFNPVTTIRFDLPRPEHVRLSIYNVKGELVATLIDRGMTAGRQEISWQATDDSGRAVSSGVYFYRLNAGDFVQTRKMILLR